MTKGIRALAEAQGAQLETFHNACLRQMLGLHQPVQHGWPPEAAQSQVAGTRGPQAA